MERAVGERDRLAELRRAVAAIEGRIDPTARLDLGARSTRPGHPPAVAEAAPVQGAPVEGARVDATPFEAAVDFGLDGIDRRLGPARGLAPGSLHECVCDESRDHGALVGFACALLARLLDRRDGRIVWISTAEARREGGRLHAAGLHALGLDPARLIEVAAEDEDEALWACEEALSCRGTAATVAEIPGRPRTLDLTATRRLALRATGGGRGVASPLGLLLRPSGPPLTTAAATRWRVRARPSRPWSDFAVGLGPPAFHLDLEKNRDGRLGTFELEWKPHDRDFVLLPPHSGAVPAPPADRSAASAREGRVLAFRPHA